MFKRNLFSKKAEIWKKFLYHPMSLNQFMRLKKWNQSLFHDQGMFEKIFWIQQKPVNNLNIIISWNTIHDTVTYLNTNKMTKIIFIVTKERN